MAKNKIPAAMAVTLGVWIAALGSAAALTYDLNRPLHVRATAVEAPSNPLRGVLAEPKSAVQPVLYLPPVTIVGRALHRAAAAGVRQTLEDHSDKQCANWRELEMGSGRVQLCE